MLLLVAAAGTLAGLSCGLASQLIEQIGGWHDRSQSGSQAGTSAAGDEGEECLDEGRPGRGRRWRSWRRLLAAGGVGLACAAVGVVTVVAATRRLGRRDNIQRGSLGSRPGRDPSIPLREVIRFKERQWFVEELEAARDGDANAMLRLSKMYLHGQGCQRNVALAQEWLRKARYMGVGATLDELLATDDPDPKSRLRQLMAQEEARRALRRTHVGGAEA